MSELAVKILLSYTILSAATNAVTTPVKSTAAAIQWIFLPDNFGEPSLAIMGASTADFVVPKIVDLPAQVRFHLYTRSSPILSERLYVNDSTGLETSFFDASIPTKIIIHGFTNDINSDAIQHIKNAYLPKDNVNVIGVDWGDLAAGPWYNEAKGHTTEVGDFVGQLVDFLVRNGAKFVDFHLLGHSLGAHVAGVASAHASQRVGRVTGLDAALPLFGEDSISERLDVTDADYVDAIHTCGGSLGFMDPIGQADFYPNGGVSPQPGCGLVDVGGSCSHGKAYEFYVKSILDSSIYGAYECTSLDNALIGNCASLSSGQMGEFSNPLMKGVFHLVAK